MARDCKRISATVGEELRFAVDKSHGRYNAEVITRGIREFIARDWQAVRQSKDRYWGERISRLGPLEGFRIADELRRQALQRDPAWPDAAQRREDLRHHIRLIELFRRARSARRS